MLLIEPASSLAASTNESCTSWKQIVKSNLLTISSAAQVLYFILYMCLYASYPGKVVTYQFLEDFACPII
jgi:hypothetical protein